VKTRDAGTPRSGPGRGKAAGPHCVRAVSETARTTTAFDCGDPSFFLRPLSVSGLCYTPRDPPDIPLALAFLILLLSVLLSRSPPRIISLTTLGSSNAQYGCFDDGETTCIRTQLYTALLAQQICKSCADTVEQVREIAGSATVHDDTERERQHGRGHQQLGLELLGHPRRPVRTWSSRPVSSIRLLTLKTGAVFYACPATGEVSWDPPEGNFVYVFSPTFPDRSANLSSADQDSTQRCWRMVGADGRDPWRSRLLLPHENKADRLGAS
jgi:hypothetical protein